MFVCLLLLFFIIFYYFVLFCFIFNLHYFFFFNLINLITFLIICIYLILFYLFIYTFFVMSSTACRRCGQDYSDEIYFAEKEVKYLLQLFTIYLIFHYKFLFLIISFILESKTSSRIRIKGTRISAIWRTIIIIKRKCKNFIK